METGINILPRQEAHFDPDQLQLLPRLSHATHAEEAKLCDLQGP